ncbi:hypothetical protein Ddye_027623 [Dipteronia dyeriana]|uniref:Uncharacterized protein n=1 Tax=Dipteronia dyeriana TaxID=168575 RepID=A0AAD9WRL6_9ROSI|nr:hypothetical protein Ddye_027623 [Dipteronia dyeriana]
MDNQVGLEASLEEGEFKARDNHLCHVGRPLEEIQGINLFVDLSVQADGIQSPLRSEASHQLEVHAEGLAGVKFSRMVEILPSSGVSQGVLKRNERKSMGLINGQSMFRRSSEAYENMKQQNSELINKVVWNLEDEVVKVLEKGIAMRFNFYGRKKESIDIITKRDMNDNRFRVLVRRLVLKHNATR